ncbi:MAG: preprotein translocase subunit SecY [Candidatus Dadabacteria bacterium]|nr:preprotein translocase subunit SecY [Candidatus Dadabacteria bacterium]NIV40893.1 preprotein translocase subunit SecY [Candidatus Dadabacteria bacterium]NIX16143.1 preprotein translocase subunit SecY [Candidatus Dadabacteria bacterium]HSG32319.1 preprotein translocase subunit SecY [Thermodesulfobacteriota bacterium]
MNSGISSLPKIPELNKRLLFVAFMLVVYRLGVFVPIPGVDSEQILDIFNQQASGTIFDMLNLFSGGALERASIFALGVMPYITSSIIMSLLVKAFPTLEAMQKEGEAGRRKINQYSRYGTILICLVQGGMLAATLNSGQLGNVVTNPGFSFVLTTIITLTAGSMFVMWIGEQISERGIGNGISLIIAASIITTVPGAFWDLVRLIRTGEMTIFGTVILFVFLGCIVAAIVFVERSFRKIPVQYPRRVVGRKVYGGQSSYLPLKVNTAGVIPPIFASSLLFFPATILQFAEIPTLQDISSLILDNGLFYNLIYAALIIFFAYFYTAIIYNPDDLAENLRKNGGFVPGMRPGKKTSEYIDKILSRLTFIGAIYIAVVCIMPSVLRLDPFNVPFFFGGTSLLIVVGVTLDTVQQIESFLINHSYEGLVKKKGMKGPRRY